MCHSWWRYPLTKITTWFCLGPFNICQVYFMLLIFFKNKLFECLQLTLERKIYGVEITVLVTIFKMSSISWLSSLGWFVMMTACLHDRLLFPIVYASIYSIGIALSNDLCNGSKIQLANSTRKNVIYEMELYSNKKAFAVIQGSRRNIYKSSSSP